jgi:hypothetical protein
LKKNADGDLVTGFFSPRRMLAMMNITQFTKLPIMKTGRLPNLSIVNMQAPCEIRARMLLIAWYFKALSAEIPIWPKMVTEKYWIAETPVI